MSFSIKLEQNNSQPNKIGKDITLLATVTGTLKEATSIIDPVIKVEGDLSNYTGCNYMTIDAFDRSYFVLNIRSIRNNLIEFTCHVDVLESFKNEIKSNKAIIKRQQEKWNLYLNDGSLKIYQNPHVITKAFPSGFTAHEFVLAVAGS